MEQSILNLLYVQFCRIMEKYPQYKPHNYYGYCPEFERNQGLYFICYELKSGEGDLPLEINLEIRPIPNTLFPFTDKSLSLSFHISNNENLFRECPLKWLKKVNHDKLKYKKTRKYIYDMLLQQVKITINGGGKTVHINQLKSHSLVT